MNLNFRKQGGIILPDKVLVSIHKKDIFINLKKIRGFSSKTIEILLEYFFSNVNIDELWNKYYEEGEESYREYIIRILNGNNANLNKKLSDNQKPEKTKKKTKIESSTFWQ